MALLAWVSLQSSIRRTVMTDHHVTTTVREDHISLFSFSPKPGVALDIHCRYHYNFLRETFAIRCIESSVTITPCVFRSISRIEDPRH